MAKIKDTLKKLEEDIMKHSDKEEASIMQSDNTITKQDLRKIVKQIKRFQGEIPEIEQLARKLMKRHDNDPELQTITKELKKAANMEKFDKLVRESKLKVIDDAMKVADIRAKILKEESTLEQKKLQEDI